MTTVSDMVVMDVVLCVGLAVSMCIVVVGALTSSAQLNGGILSSPLSCEASTSRITNAMHKFTMAFQIPLRNGPDLFSFHSNSICRSLVLHYATMLSDMVGSIGCVGICCVLCVVCANG